MHMMTPGTNNSYHYPMYHDDGSFATSGKTATGRGIMVPPPMPPPSSNIPPNRIGSNNTGTLSSTGSVGSSNEISTTSVPKFAIPHNANEHHSSVTNKEAAAKEDRIMRAQAWVANEKQTYKLTCQTSIPLQRHKPARRALCPRSKCVKHAMVRPLQSLRATSYNLTEFANVSSTRSAKVGTVFYTR